jgi:tetratricopeptide (TPR) repeat protein
MGEKPSKPTPFIKGDLVNLDRSIGENVQHLIKPSTRLTRNMMKYPFNLTELYLQRASHYLEEGDAKFAFEDIDRYLSEHGHQTLRACCLRAQCLDKLGDFIGAINEWNRAYTFLAHAPVAHALEQTTFRSPAWCHACQDLLVGVKRQGLSCLNCELNVHQSCVKNLAVPCALADKNAERQQHNFAIVQNSFSVSCEICQSTSLAMNKTDIAYCLKCEMKLHVACLKSMPELIVTPCFRKKLDPSYIWKILFGLAISLSHNFEYESALGHFNQAIEELHQLAPEIAPSLDTCSSSTSLPKTSAPTLLNSTRLSNLFQTITNDAPCKETSITTPPSSSSTPMSPPPSRFGGLFRSAANNLSFSTTPNTKTNDPAPISNTSRPFPRAADISSSDSLAATSTPTTTTVTSTTQSLSSSFNSLRSSFKDTIAPANSEHLNPLLAQVRGHRGVLHLTLKNYDECISDISFAIENGAKSVLFYRSRGNAFFEKGILRDIFIPIFTL